jgi:hypothetical protein
VGGLAQRRGAVVGGAQARHGYVGDGDVRGRGDRGERVGAVAGGDDGCVAARAFAGGVACGELAEGSPKS